MNTKQFAVIRLLFVFVLITLSFAGHSQQKKSGEVGISLGGSYYLGELNKTPFVSSNFATGAFFRHTIDTRLALTGNFFYAKLSGKEENSDYILPPDVAPNFKNTIFELSPVLEFNFIPFLPGKPKKHYFTPYIYVGGSAAYCLGGATNYVLALPFGMGAKYNINHKFIFGFSAGMRKTFLEGGDMLDYNYNPPNPTSPEKQWGYTKNKDWYSIFCISLSYKINYRMKCPAFD